MIYKLIAAVFILTTSVHAQEFSFKSLRMPVFGETGHLEQILTAESGFGQFDRPVLKGGVIEFYASRGEIIDEGSKLIFDEATFVRADEVIEGDGQISFHSPKGDLSGIGFTYDLKRSKLSLHSRVAAHFEKTEVTGNNAEAMIRKGRSDEEWSVAEAVITGNVIATGFPTEGGQMDRVETDQAKYAGDEGVIILSSPLNIWSSGGRIEANAEDLKIVLSRKPNKSAQAIP